MIRERGIAVFALVMGVVSSLHASEPENKAELQQRGEVFYFFKNAPKDKNLTSSVNALDSAGIALIGSRDYAGAIEKFTQSLKEYPDNARALYSRGHCFQKIGDFEKAVADYKKAESLAPWLSGMTSQALGTMYLTRGRSRIDLGDIEGAVSDLNVAASKKEARPAALSELAYIASQRRDYKSCIDLATKSARLEPNFSDPLITKGACLIGIGGYQDAIQSLNAALAVNPKAAAAYLNRATAHVLTKNCQAARKDAAAAVAVDESVSQVADSIIAPCQ